MDCKSFTLHKYMFSRKDAERRPENFIVVFSLRLCASATAPALLYLRAPALICESFLFYAH